MVPRDTIYLLMGLRLMSDYRDAGERALFYSFLKTLPEFRTEDLEEVEGEVLALRDKYPSTKEAAAALEDISSPVVKKKTFLLAVDIAMANGNVDSLEDEILEDMRVACGISLDEAEQIVAIFEAKYAT